MLAKIPSGTFPFFQRASESFGKFFLIGMQIRTVLCWFLTWTLTTCTDDVRGQLAKPISSYSLALSVYVHLYSVHLCANVCKLNPHSVRSKGMERLLWFWTHRGPADPFQSASLFLILWPGSRRARGLRPAKGRLPQLQETSIC